MRENATLLGTSLALVMSVLITPIITQAQESEMDRQAITQHLYSIFEAYKRQDSQTIRATHTEDWTGFLGQSRTIINGIAEYMDNAERSMDKTLLLDYEITDIVIQLYGEIAVVYYTAEIRVRDNRSGEERDVPLRSLDIYRKDRRGWNQAGSHIGVVPETSQTSPWANQQPGSDTESSRQP